MEMRVILSLDGFRGEYPWAVRRKIPSSSEARVEHSVFEKRCTTCPVASVVQTMTVLMIAIRQEYSTSADRAWMTTRL